MHSFARTRKKLLFAALIPLLGFPVIYNLISPACLVTGGLTGGHTCSGIISSLLNSNYDFFLSEAFLFSTVGHFWVYAMFWLFGFAVCYGIASVGSRNRGLRTHSEKRRIANFSQPLCWHRGNRLLFGAARYLSTAVTYR
jgi:hypothetical protein